MNVFLYENSRLFKKDEMMEMGLLFVGFSGCPVFAEHNRKDWFSFFL